MSETYIDARQVYFLWPLSYGIRYRVECPIGRLVEGDLVVPMLGVNLSSAYDGTSDYSLTVARTTSPTGEVSISFSHPPSALRDFFQPVEPTKSIAPWPFLEHPDTEVITQLKLIEEHAPLRRVERGWQGQYWFLCDERGSRSWYAGAYLPPKCLYMRLGDVAALDPTVAQVSSLGSDGSANWDAVASRWAIQ